MSAATKQQQTALNKSIASARSALLDAIAIDNTVAGKWTVAAQRLQAAFGPATFIGPKAEGHDAEIYTQVKTLVADCVGIPEAPTKKDDPSEEGDALRYEKQKAQMKVNTYMSRMASFVTTGTTGRESAGAAKAPREVFGMVAKRIRNLYFGKSETVNKVPSPEFGRDIQCLAIALETMEGSPTLRFSRAWEAAVAKMDGIEESAKEAVKATPKAAAKTLPKGRKASDAVQP